MSNNNCIHFNELKTIYINWLSEQLYTFPISENSYFVTLPFLDKHNDNIELKIMTFNKENDSNQILIEYMLNDMPLKKQINEDIMCMLNGYNIKIDIGLNRIYIYSDLDNFPRRLNSMIQCAIIISNLCENEEIFYYGYQ